MTPIRKTITYALFGILVGVHLYCFVLRRDHWPFSHYQMYAGLTPDNLTYLEMAGIPVDDPETDFTLPAEGVYPPRTVRVSAALRRLVPRLKETPEGQETLQGIMNDLAALYERQRLAEDVSFPPLRGIRVYEQTWILDRTDGRHAWKHVSKEKLGEGFIRSAP